MTVEAMHARTLARCARKLDQAHRDRDAQIVLAHRAGLSHRMIADAVGLSGVGVLKIVRRSEDAARR
jgi:hypothetical protein